MIISYFYTNNKTVKRYKKVILKLYFTFHYTTVQK